MLTYRNYTSQVELEEEICISTENGQIEHIYTEIEVTLGTNEAEPDVGLAEGIDELTIMSAKLEIVNYQTEESIFLEISTDPVFEDEKLAKEFDRKLHDAAESYLEGEQDNYMEEY